ncbi:MAG: phosphoribosylanthranilate isomerase [Planctomycetes bacterium]|nr:phosphoribosylanthranilate isomerase [Planctomycetota bacterium]
MSDCKIKFCGMMNEADVTVACECGVWAVGFVLTESQRQLSLNQCKRLAATVAPEIIKVGVFTTETAEEIRQAVDFCGLDLAQVVANYTKEEWLDFAEVPVLRTFLVSGPETLELLAAVRGGRFLLDVHVPGKAGGTGETFDWEIARQATGYGQVILAGGLNPDNVTEAIRVGKPWAVDVSSGIESCPGVKDHARMRAFAEAVWNAS